MHFYWFRDRCKQKHFLVYWDPGKYNMGDYHTNFHYLSHHKKQRPLHVHTETSPQYIPYDTSTLQQGCVKQFHVVNRINMFRGKMCYHNPELDEYNNQERPNISGGKVLAICVAILGAHPNTIYSINNILRMSVNTN